LSKTESQRSLRTLGSSELPHRRRRRRVAQSGLCQVGAGWESEPHALADLGRAVPAGAAHGLPDPYDVLGVVPARQHLRRHLDHRTGVWLRHLMRQVVYPAESIARRYGFGTAETLDAVAAARVGVDRVDDFA
jgi:hypothetical protein